MTVMPARIGHPKPNNPEKITQRIFEQKYCLRAADGAPIDQSIADAWLRVARTAASVEAGTAKDQAAWAERFFTLLDDQGFLPAGRILAGAGSGRQVTLFNCFVMGTIGDDLTQIFESVKEAALTLQQGGGIGHDFSTLRPRGATVAGVGADASGPVSFMEVWDAMCRTISSAGARRGAMMGTLRCDHPDIIEFIEAKAAAGRLSNFNLSVLVTDELMVAVRDDRPFDLRFQGRIYKTLAARALWDKIMRATYDTAEPGVIFIDRVNARNNLSYCETIAATNPCGEQPLPPYGACMLGSINLAKLVATPFEAGADIAAGEIERRVSLAVRLLDNIIDVSRYPLPAQAKEARAKRRMGLGLTGLADALILCGLHYGSEAARARAAGWMGRIARQAYLTSAELAREKGAFPLCNVEELLKAPNILGLDDDVRAQIKAHGLRNGCLTSIAPTGTISLLAGNISSGIEPVFDLTYQRRFVSPSGAGETTIVEDYAHALFRARFGEDAPLPEVFVTAANLTPDQHLAMQAAVQPHVDSAISKTINCPEDLPFEDFAPIYTHAYEQGLKGCTTFRPNGVRGAVLIANDTLNAGAPHRSAPTPATSVPRRLPRAGENQACPVCETPNLTQIEGCWICPHCGYSPCG